MARTIDLLALIRADWRRLGAWLLGGWTIFVLVMSLALVDLGCRGCPPGTVAPFTAMKVLLFCLVYAMAPWVFSVQSGQHGIGMLAGLPLARRDINRFVLLRGFVLGIVCLPAWGFLLWVLPRFGMAIHPWLVATTVTAVLVVLALPSLRMVLVSSGIELLPEDAEQRVTVESIAEDFPAGASPQVRVVAMAGTPGLDALADEVAAVDGVEQVTPPREQGDVVVLDVFTVGDGQGTEAQQVVVDIRDRAGEAEVWVTGRAASLVDFVDTIAAQAPLALGLLAVATFVLLFLLTGSVLIPVKALVMIVLSLGASFGALVWIFQDGRAESLLDYSSVGGIEAVIPLFVFAFAFGLAMDYEVFLLSRIKEFHDSGLDNDEAVRAGLQRTGRVITSAALIIVVVFAGFVVGDLLVIKETGVALAIAVVIDATLVRILLVPATMTLLGEWNWWAPAPLRRFHARFGLRESDEAPAPAAQPPAQSRV